VSLQDIVEFFEKKRRQKDTQKKNHNKFISQTMSARGKRSSGEMKVEDVAGGSFTPEKRRLDMTEDGHSAPKERQSVIEEAMESSSMKFSPSKAARVSSEGSPSMKKGKSNITTEKHHMKVKVFQVLWDRVNSTTELVTVQNVPSKDLTSGLKGESNRLIEIYLTRVFPGEATKYSYDQPLLYPCDTHMAPSVFVDRIERLGVDLPSLYANMIPIKSSKAELMKKASDRGEPINITKDFLVAFLAYGNPDHSERGSQRLNKIVTYYQTMLHGMVDSGNFFPTEFCEFVFAIIYYIDHCWYC
jgi:hypothetical protein